MNDPKIVGLLTMVSDLAYKISGKARGFDALTEKVTVERIQELDDLVARMAALLSEARNAIKS